MILEKFYFVGLHFYRNSELVNKGGAPTKIKLSFGSLEAVRGAKVSDWLDGVTSIVYLDEFDVLAMAPGTYFGSVELERT